MDSAKLLVVLQCAYGNTEKRRRQLQHKRLWLRGLWASHTGRRLQEMLPASCAVEVINSTPRIGKHPDAKLPPDPAYIRRQIAEVAPDLILACGQVAQAALDEVGVGYIAAPHPAWRALSHERALEVRRKVERGIAAHNE